MAIRKLLAVCAVVVCSSLAVAKDKKKTFLPADVLKASAVFVMVDPSAGLDVTDPNANRIARANVEKALEQWGRYRLVQDAVSADLIMMIRKGNGKLAGPSIGGTPVNSTPPVTGGTTTSPGETTTRGGVRWGAIPGDPSSAGIGPSHPEPQVEAGSPVDAFTVYRGDPDPKFDPLNHPSVWQYSGKDVLALPDVPAVEAFRKLVSESEKQLASHP